MKSSVVTLFSVLVLFSGLKAQQLSNYSFTASSSTFVPLTGATNPSLSGGTLDDGFYNNIPLGFTFYYMGGAVNSVAACTDGVLVMSPYTQNFHYYNAMSTNTEGNVLAPLWDDLWVDAATGHVSYLTTGTPGNRVFIIEWYRVKWSYNNSNPSISFQVKLYENGNIIQYNYRRENTSTSCTASCGLMGPLTGQFASLNNLSAAPSISYVTETSNISVAPVTDQLYTFTPVFTTQPVSPTTITFSAVTTTSMNVGWTDNSVSESYFNVYYSEDNVFYSLLGTVQSSSSLTTGTTYSIPASGLSNLTTYYFRIVAGNETSLPTSPLTGSQMTLGGTMCGTYGIGPSSTFPTIGAAIAAVQANGVNCPIVFELQPGYSGTSETYPISLNCPLAGPNTSITIRPAPGVTNVVLTSAAISTLSFDGGRHIILDGRPGGTGTNREITINNTVITSNTVLFQNSAQYDKVTYCNVIGVAGGTAAIYIAGGTIVAPKNSHNTISYCDITSGATTMISGVFCSNGIVNGLNEDNTIDHNTISDFWDGASNSQGVFFGGGSTGGIITNNSFYQTVHRTTPNPLNSYCVNILAGGGYIVSGNYIGGSAAFCGGSPYYVTGTYDYRFYPVNISVNVTQKSYVEGNVITNIQCETYANFNTNVGAFTGIVFSGKGDIGSIAGNTIGSSTSNNAIILKDASLAMANGIYVSSIDTVAVRNNSVGGFTSLPLLPATPQGVFSFTGIRVASGAITVAKNTVGGTSPNSILITRAFTNSSNTHSLIGIYSSSANTVHIDSNNVSGLTNRAIDAADSQTEGIKVSNGVNTISWNYVSTIRNYTFSTLYGIDVLTPMNGSQINHNRLHSVLADTASTQVNVIRLGSTGQNHTVGYNSIIGVGPVYLSPSPDYFGINIMTSSSATVKNNFIVLGTDSNGVAMEGKGYYLGMCRSSSVPSKFYFNTVKIKGHSNVTNNGAITACYFGGGGGTDMLTNNILVNDNYIGGSGGTAQYSIYINNSSDVNANYNAFSGSGSNYFLAGSLQFGSFPTLQQWTAVTHNDSLSRFFTPHFISASDLHIDTSFVSDIESAGTTIAAVVDDIDLQSRPGPTAINGGGLFPDIGADEFDGHPSMSNLRISSLQNPASGCVTNSENVVVRIENASTQTIDFAITPAVIHANVMGVNPIAFPVVLLNTGTLLPAAYLDVTVATAYNMSASGNYLIHATVTLPGDISTSDDTVSRSFTISSGAIAASTSSLCAADSVTLTLSGYTNGGSIQWQSYNSTTGTWVNESGPGNTSDVYNTFLHGTKIFRTVVCGTYFSLPDTITISTLTLNLGADASFCMGDSVVLTTPSGPYSNHWQDNSSNGTFTITASGTYFDLITDTLSGCSAQDTMIATVNPLPVLTASASDPSICAGSTTTLTGSGATMYSWMPGSLNGASVSDSPGGTTTYTLTGTNSNGCVNTQTVSVTVNPLPTVSYIETQAMVCINWNAITLSAGSPAGGTYSGAGVTGNSFDPAIAGQGTWDVVYTYSDVNGCTDSATQQVTVDLCLGTSDPAGIANVEFFPNPFSTVVTVLCDGSYLNCELKIYDAIGQEFYSETITAQKTEIDLSKFPAGIYFVKIQNEAGVVMKQVVKQ